MIEYITTPNAPLPGGHFSQGTVFGSVLYTAGQIGQTIDKKLVNESITSEVNQIMINLSEVAKAAGTDLLNTLKTTIFITDISFFKEVNEAYKTYFPNNPPSRSTVVVANLAANARIEIEAIIAIK
ncbi:MAG: RidA family protein [Candidatus Heimdallarchaeota archaeon]|nr:RidA family protein [Candidatus Heimdallarchaeota archaeon]MDH5644880.1 RidA family protein [Candidatus Heimdallarchaeota archaeon]